MTPGNFDPEVGVVTIVSRNFAPLFRVGLFFLEKDSHESRGAGVVHYHA
jgi:hypothetical protein